MNLTRPPDANDVDRLTVSAAREFAPVRAAEREPLIDVVRGFALGGVLIANVVFLAQDATMPPDFQAALPTATLDLIARALVRFFIDGKFYTLMSFLFGYGFAMQIDRARERGASATTMYVNRIVVLMFIGLLHCYLMWYGDILSKYALLGIPLLLASRMRDRPLLVSAIVLSVIVPAAFTTWGSLQWVGPDYGPPMGASSAAAQRLQVFTHGTYRDVLAANAAYGNEFWTSGTYLHFMPSAFGKFLFGLWAGRRRVLHNAVTYVSQFRTLLVSSLVIAVACNGVWVAVTFAELAHRLPPSSPLAIASHLPIFAGQLAGGACYLAACVLWFHRARGSRVLSALAPTGRMPLTTYVTQTLICQWLFYGYSVGLGLMGKVGTAWCVVIALVVFAVQVALSRWWFTRYEYGPLEFAWRRWSYGQPSAR